MASSFWTNKATTSEQLGKRDKMLEKLTFDLFRPKTEKKFNDQIDKSTRFVTRCRVSPTVAQAAFGITAIALF